MTLKTETVQITLIIISNWLKLKIYDLLKLKQKKTIYVDIMDIIGYFITTNQRAIFDSIGYISTW